MTALPSETTAYLRENRRVVSTLFALLLAASATGTAAAAVGGTTHGP